MQRQRHGSTGRTILLFALTGLFLPGAASATPPLPPATYPVLPAEVAVPRAAVPEGWRLVTLARGDLDGDGRADAALLLRDAVPGLIVTRDGARLDTNPYLLAVYLATPDGGFRRVLANHRLIPRHDDPQLADVIDGVVNGGIAIRHGTLQVTLGVFSGMSSGMGSDSFTFRWQDGRFALIGYDGTEVNRASGEITTDSYDYLTARHKHEVGSISDDRTRSTWSEIARRRMEGLDEIGNGLSFDPAAPPPVPGGGWNWADAGKDMAAMGIEDSTFRESQALCARLRHLWPPAPDWSGYDDIQPPGRCDSMALYYGIGEQPDPSKARDCAFYEIGREGLNDRVGSPFSGIGMLMTIYANGRGSPRDLDLATALACRIYGAPAEVDGRVRHLQAMKRALAGEVPLGTPGGAGGCAHAGNVSVCSGIGAQVLSGRMTAQDFADSAIAALHGKPAAALPAFDYCDDITSGLGGTQCAARDADIADAARTRRIDALIAQWSPADRHAFAALRRAARAYAEASSDNEVDMSGTLRGAFAIERREAVLDAFAATLDKLGKGTLPVTGAAEARAVDRKLNHLYLEIMAIHLAPGDVGDYQTPDSLPDTTVTHAGIRSAERAWLSYRDAWLSFAARRFPSVARASLLAYLGRERIADLVPFAND